MSNVEHAFENALFHYKNTGEMPDIKKNDPVNAEWMTDEEIDVVETCAVYLCFEHTQAQMRAVLYPENYIKE